MVRFLAFTLYFAFSHSAFGGTRGVLFDTQLRRGVSAEAFLKRRVTRLPHVIVLGEQHGMKAHHDHQLHLLNLLGTMNVKISVGLEFFERPFQSQVDDWIQGRLAEGPFLSQIGWGGTSFEFYRPLALFPRASGGKTVALNAPRSLTRKVSRQGLASLTPEERRMIPGDFEAGNENYFQRFKDLMGGGHIPEEAIARYFDAQSIWDDVMAMTAVEHLAKDPGQVFVIVVGDFHAAYGGGLPDRLKKRGVKDLTVVSHVDGSGLDLDRVQELLADDPKAGPRADAVFLSVETSDP